MSKHVQMTHPIHLNQLIGRWETRKTRLELSYPTFLYSTNKNKNCKILLKFHVFWCWVTKKLEAANTGNVQGLKHAEKEGLAPHYQSWKISPRELFATQRYEKMKLNRVVTRHSSKQGVSKQNVTQKRSRACAQKFNVLKKQYFLYDFFCSSYLSRACFRKISPRSPVPVSQPPSISEKKSIFFQKKTRIGRYFWPLIFF